MNPSVSQPLPPIDRYRSYLHVLARAQLHPQLKERLDASDIVQQTLLEAHRDREHFRGETSAQLAGWLRRILGHNVKNALRDMRAAKRDVARERPLDQALERSGLDVAAWLAADQATPSEIIAGHERLLRLSDGLSALPDAQSQAIVLRYWQSCSLAEIAERMGRSPAAAAGLLHRGLVQLRELLVSLEES
jgi:RNA polymerase sigma-70 factor (ECF subfamily)